MAKTALTKAIAPGIKVAAAGKQRIKTIHSQVRNAELTIRGAVTCMGVGLLLIILGAILAAAGAASAVASGVSSGAVGTYVLGGVLLYIGWLAFVIGLILLIVALVMD